VLNLNLKAKPPNIDIAKEVALATKALAPAVKRLEKALSGLDQEKIPAGAMADFLYDLKQVVRLLGSVTAPFDDFLPATVKTVEDSFINTLAVGEASGVQGMRSRVQISESAVPTLDDPQKFYAYVRKNNAFELLNRALNRAAIQERWDAKKQIPGIGIFHAKRVSCTKLSAPKAKGGRAK
jgi:hypothetical protein